jgi:hypothetical protein
MAAALMKVTIDKSEGDPVVCIVKPITIVAFERQFNVGIGALSETRRLEWIYWLAYDAEKRSGVVMPPSFDAWLETIDDVELEDDAAPLADGAVSPAE